MDFPPLRVQARSRSAKPRIRLPASSVRQEQVRLTGSQTDIARTANWKAAHRDENPLGVHAPALLATPRSLILLIRERGLGSEARTPIHQLHRHAARFIAFRQVVRWAVGQQAEVNCRSMPKKINDSSRARGKLCSSRLTLSTQSFYWGLKFLARIACGWENNSTSIERFIG